MKLFFISLLSAFALFLTSCKEPAVQKNADAKLEENTKLVVDVKDHFSLRTPKDWVVKKFDTGMDLVTYSCISAIIRNLICIGMIAWAELE